MTTLCFGYTRVSGVSQAGTDKDGIPRQKESIEAWAKAHDHEVVQWFSDNGVSGTLDISERTGFGRMFQALMQDGVKVMLFESADRMARNNRVWLNALKIMNDEGIKAIDVSKGRAIQGDMEDDENPERMLETGMSGLLAAYMKATTVKRLRHAREKIRAEGRKCEGAKGYGEIDEDERRLVRHVKALRRKPRGEGNKRMTLNEITDILNDQGIFRPRRAEEWSIGLIVKLLKQGHTGRGPRT